MTLLAAGLLVAGIFTTVLGILHFFFPRLLDFRTAIPTKGEALAPFRLGPLRYATLRTDVVGIAQVMNNATSYVLVSIGLLDLTWALVGWPGDATSRVIAAWIAGWWALRAASQLYLGRRRGDLMVIAGFSVLAVFHALVALS
jgi:hypothetical protein